MTVSGHDAEHTTATIRPPAVGAGVMPSQLTVRLRAHITDSVSRGWSETIKRSNEG